MAVSEPTQNLKEGVADRLGPYSPEAFEFLRQGLDFTVLRTHGQIAKTVRKIHEWLDSEQAELSDLPALVEKNGIPPSVIELIEEIGGLEAASHRLNLHVDGQDLCWGLRDLAIEQWGLMAPIVLRHWGIRSTKDFGKMVFALVSQGVLQKQPHDDIKDFENVYDFETAFDKSYKIDLSKQFAPSRKSE